MQNPNSQYHTLLVLDPAGNVVVNRLIEHPRLEHSLDEVAMQLQNRSGPGLLVQTQTSKWFTLRAKLVEEK